MSKFLAVARWEYMERIKSKAFIISLFLTPLIMIGVSVAPALLASSADSASKVIGIVDATGEIARPLAALLEERFKLPNGQPNYLLHTLEPAGPDDIASARRQGDSLTMVEAIEGYLVVGRNFMNDTLLDYRSQKVGDIRLIENLQSSLREIIIAKKLAANGIDPSLVHALTGKVELRTIKVSKSGTEEESGFGQVFFTGYIFMMMMFILIMTSGQILVRSMLEEKSNRVVEVLMSSCSARDLMAGKILGLSGLGLTQLSFWLVLGGSLSARFSLPVLPAPLLVLLLLYVMLGYLLYAAIFVAAGAPVSTEQEAQQMTSYLVMILIVPIALAFSMAQNPNSTLVRVLSYIPLLSPSMMILRIPNQAPPAAEIAITILLLVLSIVIMMRIAAKIFRTTILSYGKRPGLKELLVLLRTP